MYWKAFAGSPVTTRIVTGSPTVTVVSSGIAYSVSAAGANAGQLIAVTVGALERPFAVAVKLASPVAATSGLIAEKVNVAVPPVSGLLAASTVVPPGAVAVIVTSSPSASLAVTVTEQLA